MPPGRMCEKAPVSPPGARLRSEGDECCLKCGVDGSHHVDIAPAVIKAVCRVRSGCVGREIVSGRLDDTTGRPKSELRLAAIQCWHALELIANPAAHRFNVDASCSTPRPIPFEHKRVVFNTVLAVVGAREAPPATLRSNRNLRGSLHWQLRHHFDLKSLTLRHASTCIHSWGANAYVVPSAPLLRFGPKLSGYTKGTLICWRPTFTMF